ncbi:MAG: hypothetical protein ACK4UQ_00880 [Brevundimonas sp.]
MGLKRGLLCGAMLLLMSAGCDLPERQDDALIVYRMQLGDRVWGFPKAYIKPSTRNNADANCLTTTKTTVLLTGATPDFLGLSPETHEAFFGRNFDIVQVLIQHFDAVSAEDAVRLAVDSRQSNSVVIARHETPNGVQIERRIRHDEMVDEMPSREAALVQCARTTTVPNPYCRAFLAHDGLMLKVSFDADHKARADEILARIKTRMDEWRVGRTDLAPCRER